MKECKVEVGQKYGLLTVKRKCGLNEYRHRLWECVCMCGTIEFVKTTDLVSGHVKSCGCMRKGRKPKKV